LIDRIEDPSRPPARVQVDAELRVRASSGTPRRRTR
jgi:hypothetical protein